MVVGALATGALLRPCRSCATAAQPATPVTFEVPAGACDCHTHIHGDPARFPFFAGRTYTPEPALPEEMAALHKALHIQRVVIVTLSVYGTDNAATLWHAGARADARGVAVIDDQTSECPRRYGAGGGAWYSPQSGDRGDHGPPWRANASRRLSSACSAASGTCNLNTNLAIIAA